VQKKLQKKLRAEQRQNVLINPKANEVQPVWHLIPTGYLCNKAQKSHCESQFVLAALQNTNTIGWASLDWATLSAKSVTFTPVPLTELIKATDESYVPTFVE